MYSANSEEYGSLRAALSKFVHSNQHSPGKSSRRKIVTPPHLPGQRSRGDVSISPPTAPGTTTRYGGRTSPSWSPTSKSLIVTSRENRFPPIRSTATPTKQSSNATSLTSPSDQHQIGHHKHQQNLHHNFIQHHKYRVYNGVF